METVHCYGGRRYGASQIMRYVCDDIGIGFGCILFLPGDFFVDIQPGDTECCDGDNIIPGGGFYIVIDSRFDGIGHGCDVVIGVSGFDIGNNAYLLYRKGIVGFHAEYHVFAVKPFCKILLRIDRVLRIGGKNAYGMGLVLAQIIKTAGVINLFIL